MSNGPTSQPNTPGGPGHQSGPPGYPPQGHPGHPGYHPQGYFLIIIIRSKMFLSGYPSHPGYRPPPGPYPPRGMPPYGQHGYAGYPPHPGYPPNPQYHQYPPQYQGLFFKSFFQNIKIYFRLSTRSTRTISTWWSSRTNGRTIKSKSTESIWSASLRWSTGTFEFLMDF